MALPVTPPSGHSPRDDDALPPIKSSPLDVELPSLPPITINSPELSDRSEQRQEARPSSQKKKERPKVTSSPKESPSPKPDIPEGYARDERTGVVYKKLPETNPELVDAYKRSKGAITKGDLLRHGGELADIKLNNLNASADEFLAHLRVPVSKEEMEEARRVHAERAREERLAYEASLEEE